MIYLDLTVPFEQEIKLTQSDDEDTRLAKVILATLRRRSREGCGLFPERTLKNVPLQWQKIGSVVNQKNAFSFEKCRYLRHSETGLVFPRHSRKLLKLYLIDRSSIRTGNARSDWRLQSHTTRQRRRRKCP